MEFLTVVSINEYLERRITDEKYVEDMIEKISSDQPEILRYLYSTEINRFSEIEISYLILCGIVVYDIYTHFHGEVSFVSPRQLKNIEEDNINAFYQFLENSSNDSAALMKMLSENSDEPNIILVPVQFYRGFSANHKYDVKPENYIFSLMHFKTVLEALAVNSRKKFFRDKAPEKLIPGPEERKMIAHDFNLHRYLEYYSYDDKAADFGRKVGRNELCPCGSGKKYKKCCGSEK